MPVVKLELGRFAAMVGSDRKTIVEALPFVGLDIEETARAYVRVEYSPNRPDLGSDFGIAAALKGVLGKETGLAKVGARPSGIKVFVDRSVSRLRPFIACATASGLELDDEDVRQIISLQEDLHNGLGRRRRLAAIGLHDLRAVVPDLRYGTAAGSLRFTPLGGAREASLKEILGSKEGRAYFQGAGGRGVPLVTDSAGTVLSVPPIINGAATAISSKTRAVLVEVTGPEERAVDEVLAIMSTTLAMAGGKIGSVEIVGAKGRTTPDLTPLKVPIDLALIRQVLGVGLSEREVSDSLRRSRLGVEGGSALVPRHRIDILHPVDLAEEVALGYGFQRFTPVYPPSESPGAFNEFQGFLDDASTVMAGEGMIEMMTYELTDEKSLYSSFSRPSRNRISVQNPKSAEHSVLRDSLIPSLLSALTSNAHNDYPQRVYEVGRVYRRGAAGVEESWNLGCLVAHSQAGYSEARMFLDALCRTLVGKEVSAEEAPHWALAPGRSASVGVGGQKAGYLGEVKAEALAAFGLGVPVAAFELDLSSIYKQLK